MTVLNELNEDLAAADAAALIALGERLVAESAVEHLAIPRRGLYLLHIEDSVQRDGFYLGEVPVAVAHVALSRGGARAEGGAALLGARAEAAVAAAICDAVVRADWEGADAVRALAASGAAVRAERERRRAFVLDRTRVEFAELGRES